MSTKDPISPDDLPSACRTWDRRRRVWVAKIRYNTKLEAETRSDLHAYKCPAGQHFHAGHPAKWKTRR